MRGVNLKVSTFSTAYARPELGSAYPMRMISEVLWGRNEGDHTTMPQNTTTRQEKHLIPATYSKNYFQSARMFKIEHL